MEPHEPGDLLLPSAAARLLGCSAAAIRLWIRVGKLPALTLSGGVRAIRREDLEHFGEARAARSLTPRTRAAR
jgi:excisionase family DNA binding protein